MGCRGDALEEDLVAFVERGDADDFCVHFVLRGDCEREDAVGVVADEGPRDYWGVEMDGQVEGVVLVEVEDVVVSCPVEVVAVVGECYRVPLCRGVALYCCWPVLDYKIIIIKKISILCVIFFFYMNIRLVLI